MKPKVSANEKRLAKLIREARHDYDTGHNPEMLAAFLAKRGVLVVCAATVPDCTPAYYHSADLRVWLRQNARGAR